MTAATEPSHETGTDYAALTRVQKLAILLLMLGSESAGEILKNLDDHELEAVSAEMSRTPMVTQEIQAEVLNEFAEIALHAGTSVTGGVEFTQAALEKGVGLFKAANIVSRVSSNRAPAAIRQITELEPRQLYNLIRHEQPQAIALIASYLPPEKASRLMGLLPAGARQQVIERLATLAPTPIEAVERVAEVLNQKLGGQHIRAMNQTGGVKAAANLLNALDKHLSQSLLTSLGKNNPELGEAIRQKMFTFEDIAGLEPLAIQRILREADTRDLAIALKSASDRLKAALLGAISKRAAEAVVEEMQFMGQVKMRDIEAAQLRVIEMVRRLEAAGDIDLSDARENDTNESLD